MRGTQNGRHCEGEQKGSSYICFNEVFFQILEGELNKVQLSKNKNPQAEFKDVLQLLYNTVKNDIATL